MHSQSIRQASPHNICQYFKKKSESKKKGRCLSHRAIKHCAGYDINDLHRSVLRAVSRAKVSGFRSARDFCTWRHVAQIEAFAYTYIHTCAPRSISAYYFDVHITSISAFFLFFCKLIICILLIKYDICDIVATLEFWQNISISLSKSPCRRKKNAIR